MKILSVFVVLSIYVFGITLEVTDLVKGIIGVLTFGPPVILFILRNSKNKKWRAYAEKWTDVSHEIIKLMKLAESLVGYSGSHKKRWVLTEVALYCMNNGIIFEKEKADRILEEHMDLTKSVNLRLPKPTDEIK